MEKSFDELLEEARAAVPSISPQEANELRLNDPNTLFIDPRDLADIQSTTGRIPGAINVTLSELNEKDETEFPHQLASRTRPIIASCQGGPMGALAAHALKRRGYSNVRFIDGGTQGWLDAGFATAH